MSDPFIGEIRIFAGNFAPRGWTFCNGQNLLISQNTAVFATVGTIYGGDGRTTFGVPNLQGRAPMHPGSGPGLTPRTVGQLVGAETATLNSNQIPSHTHSKNSLPLPANQSEPASNVPSRTGSTTLPYGPAQNLASMSSAAVGNTGSGQSHENMQPFLAINFIFALEGTFASRG